MNRATEEKLKTTLTDAIAQWFDDREIALPFYVGENISAIMAQAALAVLVAVGDAQEYLRNEGLLEE